MLILILIDVQYSQNAVYSFEKDSNNQNHSSGSYHSVKKLPPAVFTTSLHEKEQCLIIETLVVNIWKFIVNKIDRFIELHTASFSFFLCNILEN